MALLVKLRNRKDAFLDLYLNQTIIHLLYGSEPKNGRLQATAIHSEAYDGSSFSIGNSSVLQDEGRSDAALVISSSLTAPSEDNH